MINKLQIEIIMKEMRKQIGNRNDFLNGIKEKTLESRKEVSLEKIKQELDGIEKNVLAKKNQYSKEELEEFEIIKSALNQLINEKEK